MVGHAFVSCDDVGVCESTHMANVEVSRDTGVGEMDEEFFVMFLLGLIDVCIKPLFLPFGFGFYVVVVF